MITSGEGGRDGGTADADRAGEASGAAAFIASVCLQVNRLSDAAVSEADKLTDFSAAVPWSAKVGLRLTMTLVPIALLVFSFFWFRRKYILTDARLAGIAAEMRGEHS